MFRISNATVRNTFVFVSSTTVPELQPRLQAIQKPLFGKGELVTSKQLNLFEI